MLSRLHFWKFIFVGDSPTPVHTYVISGPSEFTGKSFTLQALYDGVPVSATWTIIGGGQYATINQYGRVDVIPGTTGQYIIVHAATGMDEAELLILVSYDNQLVIECPDTITGESATVIARYNNNVVSPVWTIPVGSQYATINQSGEITILGSGTITLFATYEGYTDSKQVELVYQAGTTQETTVNPDGSVTETTTTETTDPQTGVTTTESTSTTTNPDGSQSQTITETETNPDGSSTSQSTTTNEDGTSSQSSTTTSAPDPTTGAVTSQSTTTNYDENGDPTGSSANTTVQNTDGSSTSTTTNYDENGDPTYGENQNTDTSGNTATQEITYDDEGNQTVTGFEIDTSGSEEGEKSFNGDGINTEFYAFDVTDGFILHMHFGVDVTNKPPSQNENHHNVLTMKRSNPSPWYGFQLRQSNTNKYIQLGTQFDTGGNTNTTINPPRWIEANKIAEYDIEIVYDPIASTNKFVCRELIGNTVVFSANKVFPDLEALRYLNVCIGYAQDDSGNPYRYAAVDVYEFSLTKLSKIVADPTVTCDGENVTISCDTTNADIYYRLNETGAFTLYTGPIPIRANTVVETYATLDNRTSGMTTQTCQYNPAVYSPVITSNGEYVTITCQTQGANIYYRYGSSGQWLPYTSSFAIEETVTIQAYATYNGDTSEITTATCVYSTGVATPIITCDGVYVDITCETPSVVIYYRTGTSGQWQEYNDAIRITQTTTIQAYADLDGHESSITTQSCVYNPPTLVAPTITCTDNVVTIECTTPHSVIYFRTDPNDSYELYTNGFEIFEDTTVQAYSMFDQTSSTVVTETCHYSSGHDYSQDYLTFDILTSGTILWKALGSGAIKTIEYSIDDGEWTQLTSTAVGNAINVTAGQKVRFRGNNTRYCEANKSNYSGFDGGTATFNIEGNIHSLLYGDNFANNSTLTNTTYQFCSLFKLSNAVSAENLILPATTLKQYCYRAMFSKAPLLEKAPALPATTLATGVYWYLFEECPITKAPVLNATTLTSEAYGHMFTGCSSLNFIECKATSISASKCLEGWVTKVAATGIFVKDGNTTWPTGPNGIPSGWTVQNDFVLYPPTISFNGEDEIELSCETSSATIYYRLGTTGSFVVYTEPIIIETDTTIYAYSDLNGATSDTVSQFCHYVQETPLEASNKVLSEWRYGGQTITTPYSVNAIDGHSSAYAKGTFNFETTVNLKKVQPTYLWFQHADQSAAIYVDNTLVEKHWGGYNAFFVDISNFIHKGTNNLKVALKNNEGSNLAPAAGDFNFNATLGNVKLFTSPYLPAMKYGYDGFHVTDTTSDALATVNVKTTVPVGAELVCTITDGTYTWTDTVDSNGSEQTFTANIVNPTLWEGKTNPHLYTITLEIYGKTDGELYHRYIRPYGLRYYSYVINDTSVVPGETYTGFLLNGHPYQLRGVCLHDDLANKANALNAADYTQEFAIIQELGCNFLRLAHYPHPKEVYDMCDQLGIIVQTEAPCVNKLQSTMPQDYYDHLEDQYTEMVNHHFNHPCIIFWGLSNETTTDDKAFGKAKIEEYVTLIKNLDPSRMVGYVMSHSWSDPLGYYNSPVGVDWVGANIYVGWYISKDTNNPTVELNKRVTSTITNKNTALAFSEYGCGGTQHCHSDDPQTTTTKGNYERHDIEYQMWLHEGHIAAIRNFPQLLFTGEWQLFDIAVWNRNEGYIECFDGVNTSTNEDLRRLNNKGLVERDHTTKKDTFYLYKAEWNQTQKFVHICGKDYTKTTGRDIKCYTNDGSTLELFINNVSQGTTPVTDHIAIFSNINIPAGATVRVEGDNTNDTWTVAS